MPQLICCRASHLRLALEPRVTRAGGSADTPVFVAYGTACTVFDDAEVASGLEAGAHLLQRADNGATVDRYDVRLLLDAGADQAQLRWPSRLGVSLHCPSWHKRGLSGSHPHYHLSVPLHVRYAVLLL